jgi:hypothetical protein
MGPGHPENVCHKCGGLNIVWWAPQEAWNEVTEAEGASREVVWCPRCFALIAAEHGWHVISYAAEMERLVPDREPTVR